MGKPNVIGKCKYCNDLILGFQKTVKVNGKLYHSGCKRIEDEEHHSI